jgi:hypothetical protein
MPATAQHHRPQRRVHLGPLVAAVLALAGTTRAAPPSLAEAPIIDFRLSLFDDETGRKTSDLRGGTAIYHGAELLEVRDFTLTLFDSKSALALKVVSPKALLQLKTRIAEGDESIDVAGPGYSLAGKRWRCDEPARKIAIREEARVVFQAQLIDILK